MKYLVLVCLILLVISCSEFVTESGVVIGKHYAPPGGGMFGTPEKWRVMVRTEEGNIFTLRGIEPYYDIKEGDKIEYTYDVNQASTKTYYRIVN